MNVELVELKGPRLAQNWAKIENTLLENHKLVEDVFTPDQLLAQIAAGGVQVWLATKEGEPIVILLSQFYTTLVTRVFQIFFAVGIDMVENIELISGLEKFAAEGGATRFEIQGREGFGRVLKPYGFEKEYVVFSKPMNWREH